MSDDERDDPLPTNAEMVFTVVASLVRHTPWSASPRGGCRD